MEIEKLIKETFTDHEHVAPDSDEVLAAAQQRIAAKRAVSRPLAVAAGVVTLTLAAVTVVALNRSSGDDTQAAAPTEQVSATGTAPAKSGIADLTMPFTLGWLPEGEVEYLVHRINTGAAAETPDVPVYGGEYMLTVTVGGQVLNVDVQEFKMSPVSDAAFKSGPGRPLTINGKPAIESAVADGPGGYALYATHPETGSLYVDVSVEYGSTATGQQLTEIGRRIAENIRFPGTTTVTPTFGLGELPSGMRMCTFDVEKPFGGSPLGSAFSTSYTVGTCDSMSSTVLVSVGGNGTRGTAGRPVQGHKTHYIVEDGYRSLWILGGVGDAPVLVAGSVPEAELYAIAENLVLPK